MQKFLISDKNINEKTASITGQDAKHIAKVLRMSLKDKIVFTNGKGKDFISTITQISSEKIELAIKEAYNSKFESPIQITLFQGLLKDKKMDTLVRHLTELGIYAWTPLLCKRSIPKPEKKKNRLKNKKMGKNHKRSFKTMQQECPSYYQQTCNIL